MTQPFRMDQGEGVYGADGKKLTTVPELEEMLERVNQEWERLTPAERSSTSPGWFNQQMRAGIMRELEKTRRRMDV